ncbi:MAG TPA: hypothetical protein VGK17_14840 [Propionicimonas sp.]|jgi:hypothetical protein
MSHRTDQHRAHRSFWRLVTLAALGTGVLSGGLTAAPSPLTGLRVAGGGLVLLGSLTLATRVMIALERARRRSQAP